MGVENTENNDITYVGYNLILRVARMPMVCLDMPYVSIK